MFALNSYHYVNGDTDAKAENGCLPVLCVCLSVITGAMLNLHVDGNCAYVNIRCRFAAS